MTLRVGMFGCGAIARRSHIPAFRNCAGVDIVAFASRTVESATAAAGEWGGGDVSSDWRSVIGRDDVDAIDICSPNAFHHEQAIAAAEAGKHVLVEKPMATTPSEADDMIGAAEAAGVVLHVAHNMRYIPALIAARAAAPRLGNILAVRTAFGHSGPRDWAPDSTWFFDKSLSGGGALIDLGVHAIDFTRYVTGLDITEVSAMTSGDGGVEDAAQVLLRFDNGSTGVLHASWVARPAPDFGLMVFGTQGTLRVDATRPPSLRKASGEKEDLELPSVETNVCSDFVRAIDGDAIPGPAEPASGSEGRTAVAVVAAAYESARSGRTTEVAR
ncbi:MAG: Gfo/Idh/MocA family protein [Actinomycetota bacterium]